MDIAQLNSYLKARDKANAVEENEEEKPDAVDPKEQTMTAVKTHATFFARFLTLTIAFFIATLWAGLFMIILNRHLNYEKTDTWKAILLVLAVTIIFVLVVFLFDLDYVRNAF